MSKRLDRADLTEKLRGAGLRPTRQRLFLAQLLFSNGENVHVTADILFAQVVEAGARLSLTTVYNTLHHFAEAGLLRALKVAPDRIWYDTRTDPHHHFYHVNEGRLEDIAVQDVRFAALPAAPEGAQIAGVDVVIRLETDI
ncbi:MAG: iron response transcriptional regulator IrrA [Alphaproteobacteria bacterium]